MGRSAEQLCIDYALATGERARQQAILAEQSCVRVKPWDEAMIHGPYPEKARPNTCLDDLFTAPRGPDGEFPRLGEFFDECCDACKGKLEALKMRAAASMRVGAAKRGILALGKKLSA